MGDGGGEGRSTSGGQSSDDVIEKGDCQATGEEQSGGDAPDVGPGNLDGFDLSALEDQNADDAMDNESTNRECNFNSREDDR